MKITIKSLYAAFEGLESIKKEKLKLKTSYKIAEILRISYLNIDSFEKEKAAKVRELGEEIKEGPRAGQYLVKKENLKQWNDELDEMLNEEIEINVPTLSKEDLGDEENSLFTPEQLTGIIPFINQ